MEGYTFIFVFVLLCFEKGISAERAQSYILTDDRGNISARFDADEHDPNRTWLIMAAQDKVIKLEMINFSTSFQFVYLEILDGDTLLGQFRYRHAIRTYISNSPTVQLHFYRLRNAADTFDEISGYFFASFTQVKRSERTCGFTGVTNQSGSIAYPENGLENVYYPDNADCTWQLIPSPNMNMQINITYMDIQYHYGCSYDYLAVYDFGYVYGRFCGNQPPPPITSYNLPMLVFFHSDATVQGRGFNATYAEVDVSYQSCGDSMTLTDQSGFITSPSPDIDGLYAYSTYCKWIMVAEESHVIVLEILFINMPIQNDNARAGCTRGDFAYTLSLTGYYSYLEYGLQIQNDNEYYNICGGYAPPAITSKGQTLELTFRFMDSLGKYEPFISLQERGFNASYIQAHGQVCSVFEVRLNGYINSVDQNGDGFYENNMDCSWVVWTNDVEQMVQFYITSIDIPSGGNCNHDYLEVYDRTTLAGIYCGSNQPSLITVSHYMQLRFHSNRRLRGQGFSGIYMILDRDGFCGGILPDLAGEIAHNGLLSQSRWPIPYECDWVIIVPDHRRIQLKFMSLDLPDTDCSACYVKVSDKAHLNDAFRGSELPDLITTSSSIMDITIRVSYYFVLFKHTGFMAVYTSVYRDCGGILTAPSGEIDFIYDGNGDIPESDINCIWIITCPVKSIIELDFVNISVSDRNNCTEDFLELYVDRFAEEARSLTTCGSYPPPTTNFTSELVYLHFVATNQPDIWTGFQANYRIISNTISCGGFLNAVSAYFNVTIANEDTPNIINCRWHIQTRENYVIELKLLRIHITEKEECETDFIKVYDGASEEANLIAHYCGTHFPPILVSSDRDMYVHFRSENRSIGDGFEAIYAESKGVPVPCGAVLSDPEGTVKSPDYDQDGYYDNGMKCDWTLITEPGRIIKLSVKLLFIETDSLCRYDRFMVFDGIDDQSPSFGTWCSKTMFVSKVFRSSTNLMHIQFISDNSLNEEGFIATFISATEDGWKKWPNGDYSIPMSIYGCPEQEINNWRQGHINMTFNMPFKTTVSSFGELNRYHDLFTLGPIGTNSIQLNFCTKEWSNITSEDAEWPRGVYAIYKGFHECQEYFETSQIVLATGDAYYTSTGKTPQVVCMMSTEGMCKYTVKICIKTNIMVDANRIDRPGTDLRDPFIVLSLKLPALYASTQTDANVNETTLLQPNSYMSNSSMTVASEAYSMTSNVRLTIGVEGKWLTFWMVTPGDITNLFLRKKGIINATNFSTLVLGLPPSDNIDDQIWLTYDLSRAVPLAGIRFLQSDEYAAIDDVSGIDIPAILLSNTKWHYLHHGSWHCLPYQIIEERRVEVYCANHEDYLKVRYLTLKEKDSFGRWLRKLRSRTWSVWALLDNNYSGSLPCRESLGMDNGFIQDFQISKSPLVYRQPSNDDQIIDRVWCFSSLAREKHEFIQIDLLQPTKIEEIEIHPQTNSINYEAIVYFVYSNDSYNLAELARNEIHTPTIQPLIIHTIVTKYVYTFERSVTARYLRGDVLAIESETCMTFTVIGCLRSNYEEVKCKEWKNHLKSMHRNKNNACELRESQFILDSYFFEEHALTLQNVTLDECLSGCNEDFTCSAVHLGTNCTWFNSSPSNSYGSLVEIDRNGIAYLKICSPVESYKTTPFLSGNLTWNDITTIVRKPGIIVSHDYPFRYSYGQLWCWEVFFNASVTVNIVVYNVSFDQLQVFAHSSDYKMRFHDYMDRLFVTTASFDANLLLTDRLVNEANGVVAVIDRTMKDAVPHYITHSDTVKLFWRTVFQSTSIDATAAGFRLLAYAKNETICIPFTTCHSNSAIIRSKSLMGDFASNRETWHVLSDVKGYIRLQFDTFDIGCQSDSVLEVAVSSTEKQRLCNINKPLIGLNSRGKHLTIIFTLTRKANYLIEGFEARYETIHKPNIDPSLLSSEEVLNVSISESQTKTIFKVCSGQFNKCFLVIGHLQDIYRPEMTSWTFVNTDICARQNWTMLSLHSKLEQDFINYMLFQKILLPNQVSTFIGLRRGIPSYSEHKWTDRSPVTFTSWKRGNPSPDLYMRCAAMTLRLSDGNTWVSIPCDEPKEILAICQMEWTSNNSSRPHQETVMGDKEPGYSGTESRHFEIMPLTSLFVCANTEIISILGRCDNVTDCLDGSDEEDCVETEGLCTSFEFRCGDGQCVSISVLCDNIPDCADNSDEECYFPTCDLTEFRCSNHKCIPVNQRCDGKIDCFDKSDEYDCAVSDCNNKNSFLCSSTYCIPHVFVCDGIADCTSGVDELNCQFPESCEAWWDAGYRESGFYEAGDSYIECNFELGLVNNSIVTKFNNIDYGRMVSQTDINDIIYSAQEVLVSHIHNQTCYLTVDQLCQPWVQRLYDIDQRHRSQGMGTKTLHACQCLRYRHELTTNMSITKYSAVTSCDATEVFPDEAFHIEFGTNSTDGLLQSMNLKPGHEFDVGMLKIIVHPIACYSDLKTSQSRITCGYGFTTAPETRCLYKNDAFGHIDGCRSLKHLQDCEAFSCPSKYFKCRESFCIERRYVCDGITHCHGGEDEMDCDKRSCLSGYRCLNSNICLHQQYLCDGFPQCPHGDDERLCNFTCPTTCTCLGLAVHCTDNKMNEIEERITIPGVIRMLDISGNKRAWSNISFAQDKLEYLVYLNVSRCAISNISLPILSFMRNLRILDLSWNELHSLPSKLFASQTRMKTFRFVNNMELLTIQPEAFWGLESIGSLSLNHLRIERIRSQAFASLNLDFLDLTQNVINYCEDNAFATLQVNEIFLNASIINEMPSGVFKGIQFVNFLVTDSVKYCCIKPYFLPRENCLPPENKISSCDDLLRNEIIRTLAWIVGLIAIIANSLSFIYRLQDKERLNIGYGIFVTNLNISDFFMGVYLLIIAAADMDYRSVYYLNDESWRNSWLCQLAGILALLSTETSVMFICLITLDRVLVIKFPFGDFRLSKNLSWRCVFAVWFIGLFVATFPVVFTSYFKENFYSGLGVCLALPLSKERQSGWQYSISIFIGFNCVSFLLIAAGQWFIFNEVATTSKAITSKSRSNRKKELRVARNLFLVALTNFLCWAPVAFVGALMLSGIVISGETYAWIAVFVLPINSALNPFLYTLMAIVKKETMVPEKDECVKTLTFPKDQVEAFFKVWQNKRFFINPRDEYQPKYQPLSSLLDQNTLRLQKIIWIAKEILKLLECLHMRAIAHKELVMSDIFVQISSKGALNVALNSRPELASKAKTKAENIKSFGRIFSSLLDACIKEGKD